MKKAVITAELKSPIEKVWNVVTDHSQYGWRSDLSRITLSDDGKSFSEFTKKGYRTDFSITHKLPYTRYEFEMENTNIKGVWTGIFSTIDFGTRIEFTETLEVKRPILRLFAGLYLKQQQKAYVSDLKRALREQK